jgi:HlyD family secretion protein
VKNAVFRRSSLERLASPEQLDALMRVTTPVGWIVHAAMLALLAAVVLWGAFGSITIAVEGQGIIVTAGGVKNVQHVAGGRITDIKVEPGDLVLKGEVIARVNQDELIGQIAEERIKLSELLESEARTTAFSEQDLALRRTYLGQQDDNMRSSIQSDKEQLAYLEKTLPTYEELYQGGGISEKQLLETRARYNSLKVQVADNENMLRQIQWEMAQMTLSKEEEKTGLDSQVDEARRNIARLERNLAYYTNIVSPDAGRVIEVMVNEGTLIGAGATVVSIEPVGRAAQNLEAVIYIPSEGKSVRPGMDVQVSPANVKREEYGFIRGRVTFVSPYPATAEGMLRVLGNASLVEALLGRGAVLEVRVDLVPTTRTVSGLKWSSKDGPPAAIQSGTICSGSVIEKTQSPISYVIPWLRELAGN